MKFTSLITLGAICCIAQACGQNRQAAPPSATPQKSAYYTEQHRPQYHFSPQKNWMNDPNGMVYYDGEYHFFYQYYPDKNVWGPMHWGHAVSTDLVHWEHLPIALYPDSLGYIFSGSAVVDWNNTSGVGKNGQPPLVAIFTYHNMDREKAGRNDVETQGIAYSTDRGRTWVKYSANPVIDNPEKDRDFRDPKVVWHEDTRQWIMVLAVGNHAEFWGSPNLKNWKFLSDFGQNNGAHGGVWECPDLFPIQEEGSTRQKWVLLLNINPGHPNGGSGTQYFVGDFGGKTFELDPSFAPKVPKGTGVWLDYGKDNYAGVTWSDMPKSDGRRVLIGWMSNWEYALVVPTEAWRSANTLPRALTLKNTSEGYVLVSNPVKETEKLRGTAVDLPAVDILGAFELAKKINFVPTLSEMELEIDLGNTTANNIGVELSNASGETYQIGYNKSSNQFYSDRQKAGNHAFSATFGHNIHTAPRTAKENTLQLHLFFDQSSVELFADGGTTTMTEVFFPTTPFTQAKIFGHGGKVRLSKGRVYPLKSIWKQ